MKRDPCNYFRILNLSNKHTEKKGNCGLFSLISTQCYGNNAWKSQLQIMIYEFIFSFDSSLLCHPSEDLLERNTIIKATFQMKFFQGMYYYLSLVRSMVFYIFILQYNVLYDKLSVISGFFIYRVQKNYAFTVLFIWVKKIKINIQLCGKICKELWL